MTKLEQEGLKNKKGTKPRNIVEDSAYTTGDEKDTKDEDVYNIEANCQERLNVVKWENYSRWPNLGAKMLDLTLTLFQYIEEDTSRIGNLSPFDFARLKMKKKMIWCMETWILIKQNSKENQSLLNWNRKKLKENEKEMKAQEIQNTICRNGGHSEGGGLSYYAVLVGPRESCSVSRQDPDSQITEDAAKT